MRPTRLPEGMHYGYTLRNFFTGDIICEREFETRDEMEQAMAEDLAPDALIGKVLGSYPTDDKE